MGTSERQLLCAWLVLACRIAHVDTSVGGSFVVWRGQTSALFLERCRLRRRSISVDLGTARVRQVVKLIHLVLNISYCSYHTSHSGQHTSHSCRTSHLYRTYHLYRTSRLWHSSLSLRFRESARFFASSVDNSSCDVRSSLFSTRS